MQTFDDLDIFQHLMCEGDRHVGVIYATYVVRDRRFYIFIFMTNGDFLYKNRV